MTGTGDDSSTVAALSTLLENLKNLPGSTEAHFKPSNRVFGRQKSVHELLGGGSSADVLLWRKKHISAGFLAGATVIWILFEWVGYHFVSLLSLLLLLVLVALFAWSNAAFLLNRSPPPVPKVQLSDELVLNVASMLRVEINRALATLHDIALGNDIKLFLKVAVGLWLLSVFGGWFQFLTLFYLGAVAVHTLPVIYEKNEDTIDKYAQRALDELHKHFKKVDTAVLSKIPLVPSMVKKTE